MAAAGFPSKPLLKVHASLFQSDAGNDRILFSIQMKK
jgi:hypothetical protein